MPKPLLLQSDLTKAYHIVTRYTTKLDPNGLPYIVAQTKYDATAEVKFYIEQATAPLRQELAQAHERIRVLEECVGWSKTEALVLDDLIMHAQYFSAESYLAGDTSSAGCWKTVATGLADLKEKRDALVTAKEVPHEPS